MSALIASGYVAQIPYHLNRAMDNGLTKAQASEVLTHLAFYAGWPNVITAGCGWVQHEGGPVEVVHPGDTVWFPAGEKHWHGASPTTGMTHIAITESLDGKVADWLEKVTDEQYRR